MNIMDIFSLVGGRWDTRHVARPARYIKERFPPHAARRAGRLRGVTIVSRYARFRFAILRLFCNNFELWIMHWKRPMAGILPPRRGSVWNVTFPWVDTHSVGWHPWLCYFTATQFYMLIYNNYALWIMHYELCIEKKSADESFGIFHRRIFFA